MLNDNRFSEQLRQEIKNYNEVVEKLKDSLYKELIEVLKKSNYDMVDIHPSTYFSYNSSGDEEIDNNADGMISSITHNFNNLTSEKLTVELFRGKDF
jgi:aspartate/tyrosine/aromatic aminotransferase